MDSSKKFFSLSQQELKAITDGDISLLMQVYNRTVRSRRLSMTNTAHDDVCVTWRFDFLQLSVFKLQNRTRFQKDGL